MKPHFITLPYHPVLAFALFYVPGLISFIALLGLVGAVSPQAGQLFHKIANIVPLGIAFFAAWRAALPDGSPLYRFTGYDRKTLRASLKKNIWLYAVAFGLLALLTDVLMVVVAYAAGTAEGFHYSIIRLWLIAGVYSVVAKMAIESTFKSPMNPEVSQVSDDAPQPHESSDFWVLRDRDS